MTSLLGTEAILLGARALLARCGMPLLPSLRRPSSLCTKASRACVFSGCGQARQELRALLPHVQVLTSFKDLGIEQLAGGLRAGCVAEAHSG